MAARGHLELGLALLDQTALAGLGNVFKSEVAFACGLNPFRQVATLTAEQLADLIAIARQFLLANVTEPSGHRRTTTSNTQKEENLWVYGRKGQPCRRCATPIRSQKHAADGRISFWCPVCQR
jgi:endonuclease-8